MFVLSVCLSIYQIYIYVYIYIYLSIYPSLIYLSAIYQSSIHLYLSLYLSIHVTISSSLTPAPLAFLSRSSHCPQTPCVSEDDLDLLVLQFSPPQAWDHRHVTHTQC